jgi:hypothetical protein
MRPDLEQRAEELARRATCTRCGCVILESVGAAGAVTGTLRSLAVGSTEHIKLCGGCAFALRLFLERDGGTSARAAIQERWDRE